MQKYQFYNLRFDNGDGSLEDMMLLCQANELEFGHHPFKADFLILAICLKGYKKLKINMREFVMSEKQLLIILPDQTVEIVETSEDYQAYYLILSRRFEEQLLSSYDLRISILLSIKENPVRGISERSLSSYVDLYNVLRRTISADDLFYKVEFVKHIILAFRYGVMLNEMYEVEPKHKAVHERITREFLDIAHEHCRTQRMLDFYAQKLSITPKHLSKVVADVTGKTAKEWIDSFVVLEARRLLRTSTLSVQQISDELNFPTQSFFGKYFKRHTGFSPRRYRELP